MKLRCAIFGHRSSGPLSGARTHCTRCGVGLGMPVTEQSITMPMVKPPRLRLIMPTDVASALSVADALAGESVPMHIHQCGDRALAILADEVRRLHIARLPIKPSEWLDNIPTTSEIIGDKAMDNDPDARAAVHIGVSVLGWIRHQQAERKRLADQILNIYQTGNTPVFIPKDKTK